ncbi:MAG: hypothetical protein Q8922_03630 [Bacteroidota bacterium]|nr:hypothetical protein [Bacteroidota bacterium]MDP4233383.1 hypothetical protein [Bacteroidota bacterium]MDP4242249.1 hypothetical protein [Bacteroidota bacterium]MDP4287005.1 hypothetical protein [Bacteroidota bacterium]
MLYTTFVILHLIFVGIAVGIVAVTIIGRITGKAGRGTMGELLMIRSMANLGEIMGKLALIGLLVTGVALTLIQYSFFPFSTFPWLAFKQCVFIVLMVVAFVGTIPRGEKIKKMAIAELQGANAMSGASEELRALVSRQFATVILIGILVLTNMTLGESKAMMWVTGQ